MVDHTDMAMDSIVPKHEPGPDGSISSTVSTPDPEAEPLTQDAAQTQKRKGGRKPVRNIFSNLGPRNSFVSLSYVVIFPNVTLYTNPFRYMPPPKNESSATGRPRRPSENAGRSTSAS